MVLPGQDSASCVGESCFGIEFEKVSSNLVIDLTPPQLSSLLDTSGPLPLETGTQKDTLHVCIMYYDGPKLCRLLPRPSKKLSWPCSPQACREAGEPALAPSQQVAGCALSGRLAFGGDKGVGQSDN